MAPAPESDSNSNSTLKELEPKELDALFPPPALTLAHARLPGPTRASGAALARLLRDDHVRWHAFFNDRGFHNHATHHLVAIYALGASPALLDAAYETHVAYMRPALPAPAPLDEHTFWAHLGQREYYASYLAFFRTRLLASDARTVLETYVFSPRANVGDAAGVPPPRMLARFFAALVHPLIHTGNGLECGVPGLVAEGLAQTAVHADEGGLLLFPPAEPPSLATLSLGESEGGMHAFTVLARVLGDDRFAPSALGLPLALTDSHVGRVQERVAGPLLALVDAWAAPLRSDSKGDVPRAAIEAKMAEVTWMNALVYGVGGWGARARGESGTFNADFFLMHLVTSSLFLPTLVAHVSPGSAAVLLRGYFTLSLAWYIGRGRPALPIRAFFEETSATPAPPVASPAPPPPTGGLTPLDPAPNPWLGLVEGTLVHPAEHLCKTQRALMYASGVYGEGGAAFTGLELEGADSVDGTLFVRAAGLTAGAIGWVRAGGEVVRDWDRVGFC